MVSLTSSFHHHMSPRSLLDFFPHSSSHAFGTTSLKVFHKSGASVLTSSFISFSNFTLVRFSFNYQLFLLMIRSFFITFFRTFLSRSTTTIPCWSSHGITFTSLTYFLYFPTQAQNQFLFHIHRHYT